MSSRKHNNIIICCPTEAVHRWTAVKDRWETARKSFGFESLTFHHNQDTTKSGSYHKNGQVDNKSSSITTTPSTTEATLSATAGSSYFSNDFSAQLSLQPSERLSQRLLRDGGRSKNGKMMMMTSGGRTTTTTTTIQSSVNSYDCEINLDQLNIQNLQVVGRDDEIKLLESLYHRAITPYSATSSSLLKSNDANKKKKMVVIVGPSGSGKSVLAMQLQKLQRKHLDDNNKNNNNNNNNAIWCAGKFDQYYSDPYDAIIAAISSLIQNATTEILLEWKHSIDQTLGEETNILMELVPALSVLMMQQQQGDDDNNNQNDGGRKFDNNTIPVLRGGGLPPVEQQKTLDNSNNIMSQKATTTTTTTRARRISNSSVDRNSNDRSITEKATKIQNVLVEFLRLLATNEHPITLFLDDIQWASSSALALIDALMVDQTIEHFFVLATCRQEYLLDKTSAVVHSESDGGEDNGNQLQRTGTTCMNRLQQLLKRRSSQIHQMVIGGLDVDGVRQIISTLLRMDVEEEPKTRGLATIVRRKCDGNPFFVLQFIFLLREQQLLTYDWGDYTWNWLEGDIQSQSVATNVAEAVQKRLRTLPPEEQLILSVASCIGASFERRMLEFVLAGLEGRYQKEWDDVPEWPQGDIKNRLDALHDLGILEKQFVSGQYNFSHDQVQAAAFSLIPDTRKIIMQTVIGQRLIEGLDENHRDRFLFTAVQLWGVGVAKMTKTEKKHYAFWAFLAGDSALKQGAFDSALGFLNTSIECLGEDPFAIDPQLALPLFSGAAEASYCLNDNRVLEYVKVVQRQSTVATSDMIRVSIVELKVLSARRDFEGCVDAFRRLCRDLNAANFSKKPGIPSLLYHVVKTSWLLKKYDRDKILQLPACTDRNIIGALRAENVCFAQLYMTNPNLCVIATCQAVQWSIRNGHSKATPPALVSMAMMLIGISGDYNLACEVGEIALELCDVYGYKETLPATVALVFGYVRHWIKPMQHFLAPMRYAIDLGMRIGNMDDCGLLFSTFGLMLLLCQIGTLTSAIQEIEGYRHIMIEHNIKDHLVFTECNLQFAHKMAFENDDCWSLSGEIMCEDDMFALAAENKDLILSAFIRYQKLMLNVYFGRPVAAAEFGETNRDVGFTICQGCHFVPRNTFFVGLSMVLAHRVDGKATRLRTANLMKKRLKAWLKSGNPNVLHFLHLLRAEIKYSEQKYVEARAEYMKAAKVSMRTGSKLDFALSNELLSAFYTDTKNPLQDLSLSQYHMNVSIDSYGAYGAANKVRYMKLKHPDRLPRSRLSWSTKRDTGESTVYAR